MANSHSHPTEKLLKQQPTHSHDQIWHYFFVCTVLLMGIWLRWFNIEEKPFHHDEAIFAMYGYYFFKDPENAFYRYLPMLNGPLLFHWLEQLFRFFAPLNWVARFPAAFLGTLFMFVPFFFERFFSRWQFYLLLCLVSFSPVYVYYSRFLRHEYLVIFVYLGLLYSMFVAKSQWRYFWIPVLFWLHWCIKENFYVFSAIMLGFLIYQFLINYLVLKNPIKTKKINQEIFKKVGLGLLVGFCLFIYLYAAGFTFKDGTLAFKYLDGVKDGLYRQGLSYWWGQHSIERITGPFSIHFFMLTWYEFAFFVVISFLHFKMLLHYLGKQKFTFFACSLAFLLLLSTLLAPTLLPLDFFKTVIKLKINFDLMTFFTYLLMAFLIPTLHLIKNEKLLAWFSYLFWANLFTYSYLGEKVPWLVMYPMLFGGIYIFTLVAKNPSFLPKKASMILLAFTLFYGVSTSLRTSHITAADNREFIIQVHPFKIYTDYVTELRHKIESKYPKNTIKVLMMDDPVWITLWYWKDFEVQYQYDPKMDPKNFDVIVCNKPKLGLEETHDLKEILYSGWWVPDYNLMTFNNYMHYVFYHRPWSVLGDLRMTIWIKKGLLN